VTLLTLIKKGGLQGYYPRYNCYSCYKILEKTENKSVTVQEFAQHGCYTAATVATSVLGKHTPVASVATAKTGLLQFHALEKPENNKVIESVANVAIVARVDPAETLATDSKTVLDTLIAAGTWRATKQIAGVVNLPRRNRSMSSGGST
jgi:hypothetical protein